MPEIRSQEWFADARALARRILETLIAHPEPDQAREALAYVCSELIARGEDLEDIRDGIDELAEEDGYELEDADDEAESTDPAVTDEELRDILGEEFAGDSDDRALFGRAPKPLPFQLPELRILPFPQTTFLPGETKSITVQPQVDVYPRKLMIPSTISPQFLIVDVLIGTESRLAMPGPVSAVAFSEFAAGANLGMPELKAGDLMTLVVQRLPERPLTFTAFIDCDTKGPTSVPSAS